MISLRSTIGKIAVTWPALARERRALASLDMTHLDDIGLDRRSAMREAARPFYDRPINR